MFPKTTGRGHVYENILETIGNTPLVRLNPALYKNNANVFAKLEFFNPLSSVKDRLAYSMIQDAENRGIIEKNTVLIEPTSGNTGIALAFICASKGYDLLLVMPESMSIERRKMLKFLGAKLELTPAAQGMKGAIAKAEELVKQDSNHVMLQQFETRANAKIHRETTGPEIWNDTDGKVDVVIAGVGTGGTLTGTAEYLKEKNSYIQMIAVEPSESPVLAGGKPSPHKIQGIGAGFVPDVLDMNCIDQVIQVSSEEALATAREISKSEGIPLGISSGATVKVAIDYAKSTKGQGKNIVVICASTAERYISTALFEE